VFCCLGSFSISLHLAFNSSSSLLYCDCVKYLAIALPSLEIHIARYFKRENTDNKKQISEKKQKAKLKAENEYKEFSNQFYGKKIKSKNGTTFLIYKIYKNSDGTITADLENFSKLSYGKTEPHNFENLEILKKLIAEYEKNNLTKDRPKVRKFFE
jgi:hypothetical protein